MLLRRLFGFVLGLASSTAAVAQSAPAWEQTFEISPATYTMLMTLPKGMPEAYQAALRPVQLHGTLRYRFAVSLGGTQVRVRLSNELGSTPLKIGGASIGLAGDGMAAVPGSLRQLTFGGKNDVVIPAGAPVLSDPVDLTVPAMGELVASAFVDGDYAGTPLSGTRIALLEGNAVADAAFAGAKQVFARPVVTGVLVATPKPHPVIVAFGDSITDGGRGSPAQAHGWADVLARRFAAARKPVAVVSAGIGGNRVLRDGWGPSALARADRDVFSVPGASHVLLLEGINDIGMAGQTMFGTEPPLDMAELIAGYGQIAARAHARGLKVYIGTLTPMRGAMYFSDDKERQRLAVNDWIRKSNVFDGVIDFEAALRDPAAPDRLDRRYDSGDHLHPSDAGYKAMGDAIDLASFR